MKRGSGKIKILLTFDHELPLGGIYTDFNDALFKPTDELIRTANDLKVPINLFTDVLAYDKFKSVNRTDYTAPYQDQLRRAIGEGHDVQLHLHPHWIDTIIDGYKFNTSDQYALGNFVNEVADRSLLSIVKNGVSTLMELIGSSSYRCVAFRAGGYALSPAPEEVISALLQSGLKIDSSISAGYYFDSNISKVDFTKVPAKANWYLSNDGNFSKEGHSGLYEIPIPSINKTLLEIPTFVKMRFLKHRIPANRGYMIHASPIKPRLADRLKKIQSTRMLTFDNYTYSKGYLMRILDNHIKQYLGEEDMYLSAIGHPKSMGAYSLELFSEFVQKARNKYGSQVEFVTFQDVAKELKTL